MPVADDDDHVTIEFLLIHTSHCVLMSCLPDPAKTQGLRSLGMSHAAEYRRTLQDFVKKGANLRCSQHPVFTCPRKVLPHSVAGDIRPSRWRFRGTICSLMLTPVCVSGTDRARAMCDDDVKARFLSLI